MAAIPPAEVPLDADLVAALLAAQAPHLAGNHLEAFGHGWDNEIFALGPDLLVRLPRRQAAAALIGHEILALPRLAPRLPLPVPTPVFAGRPGHGYPWRWTVVPRLPGRTAAELTVSRRGSAAGDLAGFLLALHTPADPDAPTNPYRGVPLQERAPLWAPRIEAVAGPEALARWRRHSAAPAWSGPALWLHGDPHPLNLLLGADGELAAVIDFGDVCAGDPASDLAVAWLMFDATARAEFRDACTRSGPYDDAVWARAWAWAVGLAAVFCLTSDDLPALGRVGRHALTQTLEDAEFSATG